MNYSTLISTIRSVITRNGTNAITGDTLQEVLVSIVQSIGKYCTFKGVATPSTNPSNIDQNVFYLTSTPGTYANFGGLVVPQGKLVALLYNNNRWTQIVILTLQGGSIVNIDPALDPNSVNPVENRVIAGAIGDLNDRVEALEQGGGGGVTLYQHDVLIYVSTANRQGLYTIRLFSTNGTNISSISQLEGRSFWIIQSRNQSATEDNAVAYHISFIRGGGAEIKEMLFTSPHYTIWNVPANATMQVVESGVKVIS